MDMYSDNQFHTGLPVTPHITVAHGSINALSVERGASLAAFPRRAWERSIASRLAPTGDPGTPVKVRSALRPPRFAVDLGRPVNHAGRTQALPIAATMDMYSDSKFHTGLPVTPRITVVHGSSHASTAERRASLAAFPRRAWERSIVGTPPGAGSLPQGIQVHR